MEQRERERSRTECSRKDEQRRESEKSEWMEHGEWKRARIMELLTCLCKALTDESAHLMKHRRQKLNSWWRTHDWHGCKVNKHIQRAHTHLLDSLAELQCVYEKYISSSLFLTQRSPYILLHLLHITTKPFYLLYLSCCSRELFISVQYQRKLCGKSCGIHLSIICLIFFFNPLYMRMMVNFRWV